MPVVTFPTALSAIPLVSDRHGVDVLWFQNMSSQASANSKELSEYTTLGSSSGTRNFREFVIFRFYMGNF